MSRPVLRLKLTFLHGWLLGWMLGLVVGVAMVHLTQWHAGIEPRQVACRVAFACMRTAADSARLARAAGCPLR